MLVPGIVHFQNSQAQFILFYFKEASRGESTYQIVQYYITKAKREKVTLTHLSWTRVNSRALSYL